MCEIGPPERPSVRPVRIMRRRQRQPLEPLEVGRRLAAHSGTALVIFKAIITIIIHFGRLPDIYKKGSRGPCDFLRAAFLISLSSLSGNYPSPPLAGVLPASCLLARGDQSPFLLIFVLPPGSSK